jgi:hypothetical protein
MVVRDFDLQGAPLLITSHYRIPPALSRVPNPDTPSHLQTSPAPYPPAPPNNVIIRPRQFRQGIAFPKIEAQ